MRDTAYEGRRGTYRPFKREGNARSDERGFVLLIVMLLIVALALLGLAANRNMLTDIGIASNQGGNTQAFYAAEAAGEFMYNQLLPNLPGNQTMSSAATNLPTALKANPIVVPASVTGYNFPAASIAAVGSPVVRPVTTGTYTGLQAWTQKYRIQATAVDQTTNSVRNSVSIDVDCQLIPAFQFLIFYDGDLELNPGATMSIGSAAQKGWIHANGDFYTSPGATETIYSNITVVGEIRHARKRGDTQSNGTGTVQIQPESGSTPFPTLQSGSSTWNGSSWVANANWSTTEAQWGGTVKNGVEPLTLPGQLQSSPQSILSSSCTDPNALFQKASVVIVDGVAKDAGGTALNSCYSDPNYKDGSGVLKTDSGCTEATNRNSVKSGSLYDYREQKTANTTDIDVAKFQQTQAGQYLASTTPAAGGEMGVLYVGSTSSDTTSQFAAVRLTNGATLASPFTVATDRPAYVQGDYNKNTPQPAAIMSDATTVLSNSWSSSYNSSTSLSNRSASSTSINVDIMTGNQETTILGGGQQGYGGGVHNLTRFLENWSGDTFYFGGSLVCLWASQHSKANSYKNPGTYYQVPNRNFTYNPFNGAMPPGTPSFPIITKGTWRHS